MVLFNSGELEFSIVNTAEYDRTTAIDITAPYSFFDFIKYLSRSRLIDKDKTDDKLIKQQFGNFTNQNLIAFEKTQLETRDGT